MAWAGSMLDRAICSYITAVFVCDTCDEDARKALKMPYLQKFSFSLHGWMNFSCGVGGGG